MNRMTDALAMVLGGALFGFGLALSGMAQPEVVLQFLNLKDAGLLLVMGGAIALTLPVYQLWPTLVRKPLVEPTYDKRAGRLDRKTLAGAAIFGLGWGICGVCPGPAIAGLGIGNADLLIAIAGIVLGAYLHGWWVSRKT